MSSVKVALGGGVVSSPYCMVCSMMPENGHACTIWSLPRTGLSYKYNTVTTKVYEAVLRIPPKNTCIKLQKRLLGEQDKSSDPLAEDLPDRSVHQGRMETVAPSYHQVVMKTVPSDG